MDIKYQKLLDEYQEYITKINQLRNMECGLLDYIPDIDDAWNIITHLSHLVQTQIESVNRTLLLIRNDNNTNYVSNSQSWIETTNNYELDFIILLDILNSLAKFELLILSNVSDEMFQSNKISCSYKDEVGELTLLENLESTNWHFNFHLEYINRNKEEYMKKSW